MFFGVSSYQWVGCTDSYRVKDQQVLFLLSFLRRAERTSKQRSQTLSGLEVGPEMDNLCLEQLSHTGAKHLRQ